MRADTEGRVVVGGQKDDCLGRFWAAIRKSVFWISHAPQWVLSVLRVSPVIWYHGSYAVKISSISSVKQESSTPVNSRSPNLISKLSFSLISSLPTATGVTSEKSLLDLDAIHAAQLAEWSDGIKVLKDGGMTSQDSANYIQASLVYTLIISQYWLPMKILTELALNIRLLDITGDGVEIPENVDIGPGQCIFCNDYSASWQSRIAPRSIDFVFAK